MEKNIIMAGFGGQGVMLMGKLLSYATCESTDKNVTFFPSYGAEQRGGTANCYVVISDEMVGSPMPYTTDYLVALNQPSLEKFVANVKPGGVVFYNSSITDQLPDRKDVTYVAAPVSDLSIEMGSEKVLNVIMLGVLVGYTEVLPADVVEATVLKKLGKKESLIPVNKAAFEKGLELGRAAR